MPTPASDSFGITRAVALHYSVAPLELTDEVVGLIATRELMPAALAEIEQLCGVRVRVSKVSPKLLQARLAELYGIGAAAISEERPSIQLDDRVQPPDEGVVRFIDELIAETIKRRATDLHVEPSVDGLRVRLRIDGLLHPLPVPHDLTRYDRRIVARTKVLAGLDPTPSAVPREGVIRTGSRDIRISMLPTPYGESVHMRLLPTWEEFPTLDDLGVPPGTRQDMLGLMRLRSGLVVASGPTGSGKSTTLHVLLRTGVPSTEKIVTIEDPVEFRIPDAVQVEVSPQVSFAQALRAVLRHDPDVILVGEMRDGESAAMAIQAALTGHLVLTSLHTDDEAQAITRLTQLGMDRQLLAASLRAVISQRLVRRRCSQCQGHGTSDRGQCDQCNGICYYGRIGLFRVTSLNADLKQALEQGVTEDELRQRIESTGAPSLRAQARGMIEEGVTAEVEIARVFGTPAP